MSREILIGSASGTNCSELERDAVRACARSGCSRGRGGRRRRRVVADRLRRRAPELAALLVAHVDRLARRIADRIVRPGRQLVLAAVARPRCSRCPRPTTWKPKPGLAITLIHGAGVDCAAAEDRHVFAAVLGEAAEAVEELELRGAAARRPPLAATALAARRRAAPARLPAARVELLGERAAPADAARRARPQRSSVARLGASSGRPAARRRAPCASSSPSCGRDWLLRTAVSIAICRSWT